MQKTFDQVKSKITKVDANFDMIEKLMIEIFKALRVEEVMNGDEGEPITTMQPRLLPRCSLEDPTPRVLPLIA